MTKNILQEQSKIFSRQKNKILFSRMCFSVTGDKTEGRKTCKQAATECRCIKGLATLKGGNSVFRDIHGFQNSGSQSLQRISTQKYIYNKIHVFMFVSFEPPQNYKTCIAVQILIDCFYFPHPVFCILLWISPSSTGYRCDKNLRLFFLGMAGENSWLGGRWIQFLGKARNQYIYWVESGEGEYWGKRWLQLSEQTFLLPLGCKNDWQWYFYLFVVFFYLWGGFGVENARFWGEGGTDGWAGQTERCVHFSVWWKASRPSAEQRSVLSTYLERDKSDKSNVIIKCLKRLQISLFVVLKLTQ